MWLWIWASASGLQVSEPNLTRYDVFNADEVFLTGTGAELVPVVKVDGRVIGTGQPGSVTKDLVKKYHELVQSTGEPIAVTKKKPASKRN